MINEIEIKNFRAFEHTRIKGFGAVNLIGGENSVGKTALLEALFLATSPSPTTIVNLRKFRNEDDDLIKLANKKVWDYFFHKKNTQEKISIIVKNNSDVITNSISATIIFDVQTAFTLLDSDNKEQLSDIFLNKITEVADILLNELVVK